MFSSGAVMVTLHDRLQQRGAASATASFMPSRAAISNACDDESTSWYLPSTSEHAHMHHWVARQEALAQRLGDALLDARHILPRHDAADDAFSKTKSFSTSAERLDLQPDIAELPVAAGLLLMATFGFGALLGIVSR